MPTASRYPVFDGHNDTLLHLTRPPEMGGPADFFDREGEGHIDLPRAKAGGFAGGLFAVFIPPKARDDRSAYPNSLEQDYALGMANKMVAKLYQVADASEGQLRVPRTVAEIEASMAVGALAAVLHFEGAEPIDTDLDALEVFYQAGLRSLGLVWSRPNAFGQGVSLGFPGSPDAGDGLTEAGFELVRACNRLGIAVDLSHLNGPGFWDVQKTTDAPLVASHSCVHAICASPRNLSDAQLDAIAESGGIVGVNFYVGFLRQDGARDPRTPLSVIADHVDYMVQRMGIDHVGIGSDYDGAMIPEEVGDAAGLPKLMAELASRGYDDEALQKIGYTNWLRVLGETWM